MENESQPIDGISVIPDRLNITSLVPCLEECNLSRIEKYMLGLKPNPAPFKEVPTFQEGSWKIEYLEMQYCVFHIKHKKGQDAKQQGVDKLLKVLRHFLDNNFILPEFAITAPCLLETALMHPKKGPVFETEKGYFFHPFYSDRNPIGSILRDEEGFYGSEKNTYQKGPVPLAPEEVEECEKKTIFSLFVYPTAEIMRKVWLARERGNFQETVPEVLNKITGVENFVPEGEIGKGYEYLE